MPINIYETQRLSRTQGARVQRRLRYWNSRNRTASSAVHPQRSAMELQPHACSPEKAFAALRQPMSPAPPQLVRVIFCLVVLPPRLDSTLTQFLGVDLDLGVPLSELSQDFTVILFWLVLLVNQPRHSQQVNLVEAGAVWSVLVCPRLQQALELRKPWAMASNPSPVDVVHAATVRPLGKHACNNHCQQSVHLKIRNTEDMVVWVQNCNGSLKGCERERRQHEDDCERKAAR
mmetsp:Transcript_21547/g.50712  ORF Transcript_21547/g.50712 Transcript_21547/m.50712 type:complete len:232 (+) Transcript_21547:168-863(+)